MQIVSPYLSRVDEAQLPSVIAMMRAGAWRTVLSNPSERERFVLLYDGLGRRVVIVSRADLAEIERMLADQAHLEAEQRANSPLWQRLSTAELVLDDARAFAAHAYAALEIEINRHCNLRCGFCPVETAPKPKAFMSTELFAQILDRAVEYELITHISLAHYSEPTLSPDLVERVAMAAERNLSVRMHTNASLFTEEKIERLGRLDNVSLVVNLPSVDAGEYARVTGTKFFDRVIENLTLLHKHGVRTELSINAPLDSANEEVRRVNDRFAQMFGHAVAWQTDSRAGRVEKEEYARGVHHLGRLSGCSLFINQLSVSWEGKAFICCQDYDQTLVFGDLRTQSIAEVATSEAATRARRELFGGALPSPGFICSRCDWTAPARSDALPARGLGSGLHDPQLVPMRLAARNRTQAIVEPDGTERVWVG